jgi:hypothetical protein
MSIGCADPLQPENTLVSELEEVDDVSQTTGLARTLT